MQKLQGIPVSPGVAIGEAMVMGSEGFRIPRRLVSRDAVDAELERFDEAVSASKEEILRNRQHVHDSLGNEYALIFDAHLHMLLDKRLREEITEMIVQRHYSPEYAVSRVLRRYAQVFESLENSYLAERANDIVDIERRLLRNLLGRSREEISQLTSPVLILAHNLTPSETARLNPKFVRGFVTEIGGAGSHTAIVAGALEIPAIVGLGPFLREVSGGELVIIDGDRGEIILQPDESTLARYQNAVEANRSLAAQLANLKDLPAETADGVRIQLHGNIEFPQEVDHCLERGADGIGLYRTEFLYLSTAQEPSEEVHFQAYRRVIEAMQGRPVVIRTFDLGADKISNNWRRPDERNPFLGLRSIRMSLRNLPSFRTQLRAIVRASALGDARVMFPLIATVLELRQAKMVLADVMEDLEETGIAFNRDMPIGMMVEVPSAVMMMDHFMSELDFVSVGTNDLVQYTLAVDRDNKEVAALYNGADPAVLKLIEMSIASAKRFDVPINVCGQVSSSTKFTMLLLGMGLRSLSVIPAAIPEIKRVCRSLTITQCEEVAARALALENARDVETLLKEELKRALPDREAD